MGSLEWVGQNGGMLSSRDRVALLIQALKYAAATVPAEIRRALGIRRSRLASVDPAALAPPDSAAARAAEAALAEVGMPMVANHSYRTYAWGSLLAAHDRLTCDREVIYIASLMHDLYFADPRARSEPHCFTLPAAEQAESLLEQHGWDENRRRLAAEAITLHLNLWPPRQSPEAQVVFVGARLDVTGYRYDELSSDAVRLVLERYPREDLKQKSAPMFDAQASANPGSRVHLYTRYLAVKWFMRHAPFSE